MRSEGCGGDRVRGAEARGDSIESGWVLGRGVQYSVLTIQLYLKFLFG